MAIIKFNNDTTYTVALSVYNVDTTKKRAKIVFKSEKEANSVSMENGFVEVNEHNGSEQADFRDIKYLYRKYDDNITYILTNNISDIYVKPEPIPEPYVPTEEELQAQFESEKYGKINELSYTCQSMIYAGVYVGEKHYSYTLQDQTNLENAISIANKTGLKVPYHADGESCDLYSLEQLQEVYVTEQINLTKHQTYFNQMKQYIMDTFTDRSMIDALQCIVYGTELSGTYLDFYNAIIEQSTIIMQTLMGGTNKMSETNN